MEAAATCSSPSFQHRTALPDHCAGCLSPFLVYQMEIQMCMNVCACRSGPHRLWPHHFMLLCHHCQHNCLWSTHMGQVSKDKSAKKKREYYFSGQSVPRPTAEKSKHMLLVLWANGREKGRGSRRWWQLGRWQCPASEAFSAHCHSVCVSVLLFIISYASTYLQAWHDTRGVFIGHMHLQKVITLTPVVIRWLFCQRIIESLALEKTPEIIESNLCLNTTTSAKPQH